MLGKCQWKIFNKAEEGPGTPTADDVVETFFEATKTIPSRRDKRDDPILEPQYKILSILHKLVSSGHFTVCLTNPRICPRAIPNCKKPEKGGDYLHQTQCGKDLRFPTDEDDWWDEYILIALR